MQIFIGVIFVLSFPELLLTHPGTTFDASNRSRNIWGIKSLYSQNANWYELPVDYPGAKDDALY
jgi:hypothetical protein